MYHKILLLAYIAFIVFMSLVTFFLFVKDKKMAQKNGGPNRIKEKTLLGAVTCGGALGGFIGRIIAHHKTDKSYFSFTIYLSLLLQAGVLVLLILAAFVL
ncbi:MAG: DUF1294 domain-containing protein [Acholeplasmatales bacterium]|nr:DUF1294 domain-containing protein [Acholeplasmatales bacterium]